MSGVLKNRKKREEAEAAAAAALTASANSNLAVNVEELLAGQPLYPEAFEAATSKRTKGKGSADEDDDSDSDKKGKGKKVAKSTASKAKTTSSDANKKRKRDDSENAEDEPAAKEQATGGESTNKEAEVRINVRGTIDDGTSSDEEDDGKDLVSDAGSGDQGDLTASGKPRQKKFIKRRLRRYLSLEDKIAVFERIVKEIDPKTRKLRYGASNEICADYFIGRKTINNIKNLFEGLIREGKDLSSILSAETMADIPNKLNVDLEAATQPLHADSFLTAEEAEQEKQRKSLETLKQHLQINHATNAASVSITNEEDSDSDKEGNDLLSKLKLRVTSSTATTIPNDAEDGEGQGGKYKTLYDDETRMRKMLKVNNVGRQTKLNDLTIERIKTIVPYCYGVKELSEMYEKQFGEKIHQSTLWRYCTELNIKIPKKTNKK